MARQACGTHEHQQETQQMNDTDFTSDTPDTEAGDTAELKRDFAKLRASLDAVKDKLGTNAHDILDRVSDFIDSSHLGDRIDNIEDELTRLSGKLKDSGRDAAARVESEVTAKPLASIAIAFGIGLLAASMLRRRP
jgi:ElaB/YqjD/DUF883 family membrane-anchored ribosome-binding protein